HVRTAQAVYTGAAVRAPSGNIPDLHRPFAVKRTYRHGPSLSLFTTACPCSPMWGKTWTCRCAREKDTAHPACHLRMEPADHRQPGSFPLEQKIIMNRRSTCLKI